MAQRLDPAARDAAVGRVRMITTGIVALGLAGTVGLGFGISEMVKAEKAQQAAGASAQVEPPAEAPDTIPQGQAPQVPPGEVADEPYPGAGTQTPQQPTTTKPKPKPAPKPKPTTKPPATSSGGS
nr:hypothetical protein [Kibdelosporangium sp. MJ126-NF4]CEL20506.1 hypothetical protein [Kibdelosporangium sp. MJ126-NF4]CTQ97730.1 hypothetical protein [Kibdelosporangium sp. MJ126-NF4]